MSAGGVAALILFGTAGMSADTAHPDLVSAGVAAEGAGAEFTDSDFGKTWRLPPILRPHVFRPVSQTSRIFYDTSSCDEEVRQIFKQASTDKKHRSRSSKASCSTASRSSHRSRTSHVSNASNDVMLTLFDRFADERQRERQLELSREQDVRDEAIRRERLAREEALQRDKVAAEHELLVQQQALELQCLALEEADKREVRPRLRLSGSSVLH